MKKFSTREDQLMSRILQDLETEGPSDGFTGRVMENIQAQVNPYVFKSSPLIGRAGWIGIAAGLCILMIVIFSGADSPVTADAGWLDQKLASVSLPSIHLSYSDLFSWMDPGSPTLFWILISIGGLVLLALLQHLSETVHVRRFSFR